MRAIEEVCSCTAIIRKRYLETVGVVRDARLPGARGTPRRLPSTIEADGLQVFAAVDPTLFAIDSDFYPDVVSDPQPDSVFPFVPRHQDLSGEDLDSGIFFNHNVRRRTDLFVGFTKHPNKSQFLFARMPLNSFVVGPNVRALP